jgi:hypothetical protein
MRGPERDYINVMALKSLSDEFCAGRLRLPGGGNLKPCQFRLKNENVPPSMNQCAPQWLESLHQEEFMNGAF